LLPVAKLLWTKTNLFAYHSKKDAPQDLLSQPNIWLMTANRGDMIAQLAPIMTKLVESIGAEEQEKERLSAIAGYGCLRFNTFVEQASASSSVNAFSFSATDYFCGAAYRWYWR
jgi:hypothetical protein